MSKVDKSILTKRMMKLILLRLYNERCVHCDKHISWNKVTIDHVIPISECPMLKYDIQNWLPSCALCNTIRASMPIEEFFEYVETPHYNKVRARRKLKVDYPATEEVTEKRYDLFHQYRFNRGEM